MQLDDWLDATVLLSYTRAGYALRRRHLPKVKTRMDGKTVVVTGATSGIGLAAAKELALLGARVCLVGRDAEKLARVARDMPVEVDTECCDLSLMADIRSLAQRLQKRYANLSVLINNAGVLPATRTLTKEGVELCFATNLLGHFLLTHLLLPTLQQSASARIINVSSGGMYTQRIRPHDLEFQKEPWNGAVAYARTKRGQIIATEMWAERLSKSNVVVNAMHPGWADTPGVETQLPTFYRLTRPFLRTPEQGADTVVWLAASPEAAAHTGKFFLDRKPRPTHHFKRTRETSEERAQLWAELERRSALVVLQDRRRCRK